MTMRRCAGMDLAKGWDPFELWDEGEDRCPDPATCRFYTMFEWVPLCAEHYDMWVSLDYTSKGLPYRPDGTLPLWEAYEDD